MTLKIILVGPDPNDLRGSFGNAGHSPIHLEGAITAEKLERAGIEETNLFVLTDMAEATAIPLVRELSGQPRIVVYTNEPVPPFATHLADLILAPDVLDRDTVVETLLE